MSSIICYWTGYPLHSIINTSLSSSDMDRFKSDDLIESDDIIEFAEAMGLTGIDSDLFYESYYNLDNRELEREYDYDDYYEVR